ncbi:MAG: glycosyltransferase [Candidatus Binatia bacterium]
MRILHLGNPQVVPALRALGHDVRLASQLCPLLVAPGRPVDARVLYRECAPDAEAFFMADKLGRQTLAYGVEDLPIPRIYWAIDVHVNFFWQRHYAALFDLVLAAQKDYVPLFEAEGIPARWLPWGIDPTLFRDPGLARTIDIAFVGVVDANRPKRAAALAELRRRFDVVTLGEDPTRRLAESEMARVFASAKIVFNESVMGDVNFRTFEAMACGALLLTERTGNGLEDLFTSGEHLAAYGPENLLQQAGHFLAAPAERERIARAGAEAVAARHTMAARMATLTDWLAAGVPRRDTTPRAATAFGVAAQLTIARGLSDPDATLRLAAERLQAPALAGDDAAAGLALVDVMLCAGREDGALQILTLAHDRHPGDPRASLLAAEIERRRGKPAEAAVLFRRAVATAAVPTATRHEALAALAAPESAAAWFALGRVLQAVGYVIEPGFVRHVGADVPRTATDYFRRSLACEPYAAAVLEHVAGVLEFAGHDEFVRGYRERQVQAAPTDPAVRRRFAESLRRAYAFTESAHQARIANLLADQPTAGTRAEQAAAHHEAGHIVSAAGATAHAARLMARARVLDAAASAHGPAPRDDQVPVAVPSVRMPVA